MHVSTADNILGRELLIMLHFSNKYIYSRRAPFGKNDNSLMLSVKTISFLFSGIGVDDVFVTVQSWNSVIQLKEHENSIPVIIAKTLKHAVSIYIHLLM